MYFMIYVHSGEEGCHRKVVGLFHEVELQTEVGKLLDLTIQEMMEGKLQVDLDRFTIERYRMIVKYLYLLFACCD